MRLLLDEHLAKVIAAELRLRGIDGLAVTEDPSLIGLQDLALLRRAAVQKRAIVTYDVADFRTNVRELVMLEEGHSGVILLSARRFPQTAAFPTALIDELERLCRDLPEENALAGREVWL